MTNYINRPTEHKTVQSRITADAQEIGWTFQPVRKPSGGEDFSFTPTLSPRTGRGR